jgi:peptidyl-tRNA hydrolase, PTH1 family
VKLIVGLGNAGPKYVGTRHNVGFDVVDVLAARWSIDLSTEKFHGWFGLGKVGGVSAALFKPTTLMNRSGRAVVAAGRFYKLELSDLLVIVDDIALPPGRIRMRKEGSAGGHNGLQDIVDRLGSDQWCRLRVGIGEPVGVASVYVLSRFTEEEAVLMKRVVARAADAAECWATEGPDLAMTRYNGDVTMD